MERFARSDFAQLPAGVTRGQSVGAADELDRLRSNFCDLAAVVHEQLLKLRTTDSQLREAIAALSRDLRTPLTALGGYLETIAIRGDAVSPKERQVYLELAVAQHRRLTRLVRAQFELTLLDSSAFPFDPQHASLSDLVNDVGQKLGAAASAAGVTLAVNTPPDAVVAYADIGLLERVLENLVSNAIQHTQAGGQVALSIRSDSDQITVSVEDTGCGIPADDMPRIFDRSFRGTNAAKSRSDGAGLGLAIARRILKLHGGSISVSSQPGYGSRFWFVLPAIVKSPT